MKGTGNDIEKYRDGKLTASERHALEKKALSDPFLSDALEGAEQLSPEEFAKDLAGLSGRISRRKSVFTPLRIAAGVLVIIGAGWATLYMLDTNQPEQLTSASEKPAKNEATKDSAAAGDVKKDELLSLRREPTEDKPKSERARVPLTTPPATASREDGAGATPAEVGPVAAETEAEEVREEPALADAVGPDTERTVAADSIAAPTLQPSATQGLARSEQADDSRERAAARSSRQMDFIKSDEAKMKKAESPGRSVVTGKVTLAEDGLALPGVNVRVKGTSTGAVTDLNGAYSIQIEQKNPTLVFSFIGLQTTEITAGDATTLDVTLAEDVSQLSEVVVTGTATPVDLSGEPVIKLAEPVGGLRAYDKYLEGNLRYPQQALANNIKGRVTIQFHVATDGTLNQFRVTKSLGFGCDEEVMRLVKEGPAWLPSTENDVPTESIVRVRMRFDPSKK